MCKQTKQNKNKGLERWINDVGPQACGWGCESEAAEASTSLPSSSLAIRCSLPFPIRLFTALSVWPRFWDRGLDQLTLLTVSCMLSQELLAMAMNCLFLLCHSHPVWRLWAGIPDMQCACVHAHTLTHTHTWHTVPLCYTPTCCSAI